MYMVLISAEPKETFGVLPSAMKNCHGRCRAVRTNARSSVFIDGLRVSNASACSSCTAARTSMAVDVGGIGLPKLTVTRYGMLPRHLPQKAPALKAEDASPHAVEVHRDDRDIDALHDAFQPAAERKQLPGARDLPFGEDAHDLIVAQRIGRRLAASAASRADAARWKSESPSPFWRTA